MNNSWPRERVIMRQRSVAGASTVNDDDDDESTGGAFGKDKTEWEYPRNPCSEMN